MRCRRPTLLALALGLAALPAPALASRVSAVPAAPPAGPTEIVPGLTSQTILQPGPQVLHVLRLTRGAPYLSLAPVLTAGTPAKRGSLTGYVRATLDAGSVAGVNGDYFNLDQAFPSGVLVPGGIMVSNPEPSRSALAIDPAGTLSVARMVLAGRYQAADPATGKLFTVRSFGGVNRPAVRSSEVILYTPQYGPATPVAGSRFEALIALDGGVLPQVNAAVPAAGTVVAARSGGGMPIGPGQVVLTAVGASGPSLAAELTVGRRVNVSTGLAGLPPGALNAIGGGPALVSGGVAIPAAGEGFTSSQMSDRTARTAIGQTADGTTLLVTSEGPQQGRRGFTAAEQAQLMASLGAVTAIGMDSGGSALQTVYDGLVIPWSSERPITDALVVGYTGMQVLPLRTGKLTPNADGVDDREPATIRSAAPGQAVVSLGRRGGGVAAQLYSGPLGPGSRNLAIDPKRLGVADGPYVVTGQLTPDDGSAPSVQSRTLIIDRTLARLRLRAVARPRQLEIRFTLTRPARVTVRIQDPNGAVLRTLRSGRSLGRGPQLVLWDRTLHRAPAPAGTYAVVVEAQTSLGRVGLTSSVALAAPRA